MSVLQSERRNIRRFWFVVGFVFVLNCLACSKKPAPTEEISSNLDRVNSHAVPAPLQFLHKTFAVKDYQAFSLEVPPHIVRSKVQGTFQSSIKKHGSDSVSDESSAMELLLTDPSQYDDFTHHRGASSTYSLEPSSSQEVEIV